MTSIKISDLERQDDLYIHEQIVVDKGQRPLRIDKFFNGQAGSDFPNQFAKCD